MKITWLGHSCFAVESQGYRIVLGPYKDSSVPVLAPVREEADVDQFTRLCDDVVAYPGSELEFNPKLSKQTAVLRPQNA